VTALEGWRTDRVFGHLKRDLDVTLRAKIVDLGGLYLCNDVDQVGAIR